MDFIQAIVLGIVQGLTEFLPISSSAHLVIVPALFNWRFAGEGFTAVIQLGTVLATWIYFRNDLVAAIKAWAASIGNSQLRNTPEARIGWGVFYGTLPVIVIGYLLKKRIEGPLTAYLPVIACTLIFSGLLMGVAERVSRKKRDLEEFKPMDGFIMGLWQCLAVIPGNSRSGSTITGGLFLGLTRETAARASFLLSVPAVTAAGLFELFSARKQLLDAGVVPTLVATVVSFAVGYWAIGTLIKFLQTKPVYVFVIYRVLLGLFLLGMVYSGHLNPNQYHGDEKDSAAAGRINGILSQKAT